MTRLMQIARNPVLTNIAHARLLPPSWYTVFELSRLPDQMLLDALRDGSRDRLETVSDPSQ